MRRLCSFAKCSVRPGRQLQAHHAWENAGPSCSFANLCLLFLNARPLPEVGLGPDMSIEFEALKDFKFLNYGPLPEAHPCSCDGLVSVKRDAYWSYCGPVLPATEKGLPSSFHEWAATALSGSVVPLFVPLLEFVNALLARNGLANYWLTIRATTPTSEYDKARWHTDAMFFSSSSSTEKGPPLSKRLFRKPPERPSGLCTDWKICATLLGQSTLFVPLHHQDQARKRQCAAKTANSKEHACTSIRCVGCASAADAVRNDLASSLVEFGAVQAAAGQCVIFRIGAEKGAIHSEPKMSEEEGRIFVNILPGTEEELGRLGAKWGMDFPRSWWISARATLMTNEE